LYCVDTRVAGVGYEGRQAYVEKMSRETLLSLVREPDNEHDLNAIAVYADLKDEDNVKIGYVPRDLAEQLAKLLDQGNQMLVKVRSIEIEEYGYYDYRDELIDEWSFMGVKLFIYYVDDYVDPYYLP
jgi:hypothetical protein